MTNEGEASTGLSPGYRVIRLWNNDVLENSEGVLRIIEREIDRSPTSP